MRRVEKILRARTRLYRKCPPQRAVSRILFPPSRTLRRAMVDDNHSSRPGITDGLERPTRRLRAGRPSLSPPYLVLLRAGFCLPSVLRQTRCALTAPFHPYRPSRLRARDGGMFSVPLSFELPRPGVTRRTALRSSDFPPHHRAERDDGTVIWSAAADNQDRSTLRLAAPFDKLWACQPSLSCVMPYCSSFL